MRTLKDCAKKKRITQLWCPEPRVNEIRTGHLHAKAASLPRESNSGVWYCYRVSPLFPFNYRMPGLCEIEVKNLVPFNSIQTLSALHFFALMNNSSSKFRQSSREKEFSLPFSSLPYDVKTTTNTWIQKPFIYLYLLWK
jgi:hypothetical protein